VLIPDHSTWTTDLSSYWSLLLAISLDCPVSMSGLYCNVNNHLLLHSSTFLFWWKFGAESWPHSVNVKTIVLLLPLKFLNCAHFSVGSLRKQLSRMSAPFYFAKCKPCYVLLDLPSILWHGKLKLDRWGVRQHPAFQQAPQGAMSDGISRRTRASIPTALLGHA